MINKVIFDFLNDLRVNNNRDWFNENKERFNLVKVEFEHFIDFLIAELKKIDKRVAGITAKDCVFRIYRDTRFAKDKTPYKTHFGAYISAGGRKGKYAGYYLHIEPGASMIAGGIHMPESSVLKLIREEIYLNPEKFKKLIGNKKFAGLFPEIYGEKLKNPPRGYSKEFPDVDLLKYKSYSVVNSIDDKIVTSEGFVKYFLEAASVMYPFNEYLNLAIEE